MEYGVAFCRGFITGLRIMEDYFPENGKAVADNTGRKSEKNK